MKIISEQVLRDELSEAQFPAVIQIEGPCLILAGAGSGKTRALTYKIAHLISEMGIDSKRILAVTFTNKAAAEMKNRINSYLMGDSVQRLYLPWVGTFHGICVRILREILPSSPLISSVGEGWSRDFTIYDDDDQKKLINLIFKTKEADAQRNNTCQPILPEVKELKSFISSWKSKLTPPDKAKKQAESDKEFLLADLYESYQNALRENNALDFDDLMGLTVRVFEANFDLAERWANYFQFRFIDEYQDTNPVQYRLLKLFCGWHPNRSKDDTWRRANVTAVGDDDQGIYSWRGADIKIIRDFAKDFDISQGGIFKLEENYRSTQNIVSAAGSLIEHNEKEQALIKNVFSNAVQGHPVRICKMTTDRDESELLTREIKVRGSGAFAHTAVFYRTNAQSRIVEETLRRSQIPYKIVGGMSFYERKEIKDLLAYLKVLVNSKDEIALLRIINYPARNIGNTKIDRLVEYSRQRAKSIWESMVDLDLIFSPTNKRPVYEFYTKVLRWQERSEAQSLVSTVEMILEESGIIEHLSSKKEDQDALANTKEFLSSVLEAVELDPELSLSQFLQQISLQTSADEPVDEVNSVTLMTLHGSKGLEFDFVYICGCEEGFLPMTRMGEAPNVEEERRLMYVGMTRARKELTLLQAQVRKIYGRDEYGRRGSQFLREIDQKFVEVIDKTGRQTHFTGSNSYQSQSYFTNPKPIQEEKRVVLRRSAPEDDSPLAVGKLCEHPRFGTGRILSLSGVGENAKVKIRFQDGERTLILKYANLRPFEME